MAEQELMSNADVKNATERLTAQLKADAAASNAFCDCWPCAKRILGLLKNIVPAPVKTAIDALIKIGDGVAGSLCK